MDRLETYANFVVKTYDVDLHSSMDRLETKAGLNPLSATNSFTFQYG